MPEQQRYYCFRQEKKSKIKRKNFKIQQLKKIKFKNKNSKKL